MEESNKLPAMLSVRQVQALVGGSYPNIRETMRQLGVRAVVKKPGYRERNTYCRYVSSSFCDKVGMTEEEAFRRLNDKGLIF